MVDACDYLLDWQSESCGIDACPYRQCQISGVAEIEREEDRRVRQVGQLGTRIADHADDLVSPPVPQRVAGDVLADGIFARNLPSRERLVDDPRLRLVEPLRGHKLAAADERNL